MIADCYPAASEPDQLSLILADMNGCAVDLLRLVEMKKALTVSGSELCLKAIAPPHG